MAVSVGVVVSPGLLGVVFFFFQAEDGIRDYKVTGVQTCALPISLVQSSIHAVGDVPSHRVYPVGVAIKGTVHRGVSREVLDVLQVSAASEQNREAGMRVGRPNGQRLDLRS